MTAPPAVRSWWAASEFERFVPFLVAIKAHDTRAGKHSRLELRPSTPYPLRAEALAFRAPCVACGSEIAPFRERSIALSRGGGSVQGGIYLAASCPLSVRVGCSRGRAAAVAYDAIEALIAASALPQGGLEGIAPTAAIEAAPASTAAPGAPVLERRVCPGCNSTLFIAGPLRCPICRWGFGTGGRR